MAKSVLDEQHPTYAGMYDGALMNEKVRRFVEDSGDDELLRLREMFAQSPSFSALLRGPDHRFVLVNPAYQKLIGQRAVIGLPVREALPEVESQGFLKLLDEGAPIGVVAVSAERIHLYEWKLGALDLIHDWEAEMYSLDWRERKAGKPSDVARTQGAASSGRDQYDQRLEHNRARFLKETGRAEYLSVTDDEALAGFQLLARTEGILPALESSHAIAALPAVAAKLPEGAVIVVNVSGRGDKDMNTIAKRLGVTL